ncbi:MAG: CapA family protein [Actinomycetota bacterium]|nr:CapA family protein [Actinomycetota bacterium]
MSLAFRKPVWSHPISGLRNRLGLLAFGVVLALVSACEPGETLRERSNGATAGSRSLESDSSPSSNDKDGTVDPEGGGNDPAHENVTPTKRFSIVATGDILTHSPVYERARVNGGDEYDFSPMFRKVKPQLSAADLAICHLETPLSPDNQSLSSYPAFNVPHQLADAIAKAGYDYCSTASNHSYDQGPEGVKATLDVLDRAGVRHDGTARAPRGAEHPEIIEVEGVKVGLLSYTYGLNGFVLPQHQSWSVDVIGTESILIEARAARRAGADFVIVSLHWGVEYQVPPSADQVTLGRRLLKTDAIDLILGHHAHVVQPIDRIGKDYVVYGMGNFLSDQTIACCAEETQNGVIVRLVIEGQADDLRVKEVTYTPTRIQQGDYVITPVALALDNPSTPAESRSLLRESWRQTTTAIESLGAGKFGVKPDLAP